MYDARLGWSRFLEVDPVEGGSANDYDYVAGDPVNAFDLDGTRCFVKCGWGRAARGVGRGIRRAGQAAGRHWRSMAKASLFAAAVVATAACVAATAGVCAGAVGAYLVGGAIGAGYEAGNYALTRRRHTRRGYLAHGLVGFVLGGFSSYVPPALEGWGTTGAHSPGMRMVDWFRVF
jgi:hypothetical protein